MPTETSSNTGGALRAIFWGGLLCGLFDIGFAFASLALNHVPIIRGVQFIAAGVLGRPAARAGGLKTASLGMVLHFVISFGAAAVYYVASRKLTVLTRRVVACGMLYGIAVFFFMNFVVVPLSRIGARRQFDASGFMLELVEHVLLVGLPIALATRKFAGPPERAFAAGS